jgi:hypothetical protein
MLSSLRIVAFRPHIVGVRTYAGSRCLRAAAVTMTPPSIETKLRMRSGYDIPQLGFGECDCSDSSRRLISIEWTETMVLQVYIRLPWR